VDEGKVVFAEAHCYWRPLFDVPHEGGIFATLTVPREDPSTQELLDLNQQVLTKLNFVRGVAHTEYIRSAEDGKFYFLETAARVGGAHIVELVEGSTGVNLWSEWAKIEISQGEWAYAGAHPTHHEYGGLIVSLAKQDVPDTSAYDDPEICWRVDKRNHVGFVLRSPSHARIKELIGSYMGRIKQDFFATLPAPLKPSA
jgi:hypothetical protein